MRFDLFQVEKPVHVARTNGSFGSGPHRNRKPRMKSLWDPG